MNLEKVKIAVIGQGYVGLPLAIEFGKKYPTLGFDINLTRIDELKKGVDKKHYLHYTRNSNEIELMKNIKSLIDKKNILNPSRIFN